MTLYDSNDAAARAWDEMTRATHTPSTPVALERAFSYLPERYRPRNLGVALEELQHCLDFYHAVQWQYPGISQDAVLKALRIVYPRGTG